LIRIIFAKSAGGQRRTGKKPSPYIREITSIDRTSEPKGMWSEGGLVVLLMIPILDLVSACSTIHGEIYIMKYSNKALRCGAE
jgi:hypothetical protein